MNVENDGIEMIENYVHNHMMSLPDKYLTSMKIQISEGSASLDEQMEKLKAIKDIHNKRGLRWLKHEGASRYSDTPVDVVDRNKTVLVEIREEQDDKSFVCNNVAYVIKDDKERFKLCEHHSMDLVEASVDAYLLGETVKVYEINEKTINDVIKMVKDDGYSLGSNSINKIKEAINSGKEDYQSMKTAWESKKYSMEKSRIQEPIKSCGMELSL